MSDLLDRVKRAADECISKGEVLAWSHTDGTNISWAEIVYALTPQELPIKVIDVSESGLTAETEEQK